MLSSRPDRMQPGCATAPVWLSENALQRNRTGEEMALRERIQAALDASGRSRADLARACGVSRAAVTEWMSGRTVSLTAKNLRLAADYLDPPQELTLSGDLTIIGRVILAWSARLL